MSTKIIIFLNFIIILYKSVIFKKMENVNNASRKNEESSEKISFKFKLQTT